MRHDGTAAAPYAAAQYELHDGTGRKIGELVPLVPGEAARLGAAFSAIEPWSGYGISALSLASFLGLDEPGAVRFAIRCDGGLAGIVVVRWPWLLGPYLNFVGILPEHQGKRLGGAVIAWMEREAPSGTRNLWLCVTATNTRARAFYEAHGFAASASLADLVANGSDEILMRKRLR